MSWPLLFLLLSFSAFADEMLEPVEVEATKDIKRFTFDTESTIDETQLTNQPIGLISPALEKVPGVVANQNGGPGGRVSFFIRGTESRHVSFTLDGLKINDTSNVDRQFDAAFMMSPSVKEITIHKGPQAVLYGSDAMGGMIEIKTRKGEYAPQTRFNVNGGSFGTIDSSLSSDWKSNNNNNNGTLTVSRFHTDGFSRLNKKRFDATERDATDITQLTSSSEHRWAPKFQTDLLASYIHAKAEQDGLTDDNNHDFSLNDQYILQQKTNYEINDSQAISLRNGFNRHQRHNDSLAFGKEFFNGNLLQNELIHRLEAGRFGLLSGLASEIESAQFTGFDRQFVLNSLFVQSSYQYEHFKLHAGLRADNHSKYNSFYTGSAGVALYDFSLQYSQGYKAPSLYQLYGPGFSGSSVGNPDLKPETNHSWELAWRKKTETLEGSLALFQNRLSNQFTFLLGPGYINQQHFIAEGIEAGVKKRTERFELFSTFTYQQFREEQEAVLGRPYNMAQVGASYFPVDTVEVNLTGRWYSSRKDKFANEVVKLNGYEVLDFSVRKVWKRDDVALQLKNVLNREFEDKFGFSTMPRSLFLHYGHIF